MKFFYAILLLMLPPNAFGTKGFLKENCRNLKTKERKLTGVFGTQESINSFPLFYCSRMHISQDLLASFPLRISDAVLVKTTGKKGGYRRLSGCQRPTYSSYRK